MLLNAASSSLLVVDIQERLLPAVDNPKNVISNTEILLQAAQELNVPVRVSEQYPQGLGKTAVSIHPFAEAAKATFFEKIDFSCYREATIRHDLAADKARKQLVICGMEAHVCVFQTAVEFQQNGYEVFVVVDAISSREPHSVDVAKKRLHKAGVHLVTTEMVLFEWLGKAASDEFRKVSALIK